MRFRVLAILCSAALMIVLDSTIVAVALPEIQRDLHFSAAGVAWVVNGYLVAFAGLLLLAGRLGDLLGSRRVFLTGLGLFTAASLLCGLAPTASLLVTARFAQGVGGALASAVVIGMIVRLFPEPGDQARAMGIYSFTQAGGATIGFVAGGVLTDALGWPAIFLINVPIGLAVGFFGLRLLPRDAPAASNRAAPAASNRAASTASNRAAPAASNRAATSQLTAPATSQRAATTSEPAAPPASQRAMPPASQRAMPAASQRTVPATSQRTAPTTSEPAAPPASQRTVPATSKRAALPTPQPAVPLQPGARAAESSGDTPGDGVARGGLDILGAVLVTGGLSAGVFAIVRAGAPGPATTLVAAGGSVLLIVAFLFRQAYAQAPLIPLRLLSRPWLLKANAAMALLIATGMGFQFLNALFVQRVMGYDALGTGLAFIPTPLVIGVVSLFVAPRLTARFGSRMVLILGEAAFIVGLILLSRLPVHPSYWGGMFPALLVMGLGAGVAIPAVIMLAMAGAAPSEAGLVSGVGNTSQQAGGAIGIAVLAAVAAARTRSDAALPATEALRNGYSTAFLVAAGLVALSLLLTVTLLRHPPTEPAADAPARQRTPILQGQRESGTSA